MCEYTLLIFYSRRMQGKPEKCCFGQSAFRFMIVRIEVNVLGRTWNCVSWLGMFPERALMQEQRQYCVGRERLRCLILPCCWS